MVMGEELVSPSNSGLWLGVLLVFMTSDPSGETVNKIHPGLVTGDEQDNNTLPTLSQHHHSHSSQLSGPTSHSAILTSSDTDTDCQRNEICHELLSWEFLTEKKRLNQRGQSLARDKKGFLFPN